MKHHLHAAVATALALPLTFGAWTAQAADVADTLRQSDRFSILAKAIEQAGVAETLRGDGPFTVFAPTDEAIRRLPQGTVDRLMQEEACRDQLNQILTHHVVEGRELATGDMFRQEMQVATASGDRLTLDGTGALVVLVPTGLEVVRVGDEVFVRRQVAAVTHPAVTVSTGGEAGEQGRQQILEPQAQAQQQAEQQAAAETGEQQTGAPIVTPEPAASERIAEQATPGAGEPQAQQAQQQAQDQQQARPTQRRQAGAAAQAGQQGGEGGITNPEYAASERIAQEADEAAAGQRRQQQQQATAAAGDRPQEEDRQRATAAPTGARQGQTADAGGGREGRPLAEQRGTLRAAMITEPDIEADNGIIHGINEVLVPQSLEQRLARLECGQQSQQR